MLNLAQDLVILACAALAAVLFTLGLNRLWPQEQRRVHNNLFGWHLNILGTTYAVILGFMLYTVWTAYGAAQLNVDLEANALRNLYRLSEALPDPQQAEFKNQVRSYASAVLDQDWPEMDANRVPEGTHLLIRSMWTTMSSVPAAHSANPVLLDHAVTELSSLTECQRTRLLQSTYRLPGIFWAVLIVGGFITLISTALFGATSLRLHCLQVASLTLVLSLVLLAIADVNLPFQGWVHVSNYAFQRAQQDLR